MISATDECCRAESRGTCLNPLLPGGPNVAVANGAGAGGGGVDTAVFFPPQPMRAQLSRHADKAREHAISLVEFPGRQSVEVAVIYAFR